METKEIGRKAEFGKEAERGAKIRVMGDLIKY